MESITLNNKWAMKSDVGGKTEKKIQIKQTLLYFVYRNASWFISTEDRKMQLEE